MMQQWTLHSPDALTEQVNHWKRQGKKIVFTNGVFDILHLGHVEYLAKAKAMGDKLIVAVNSDESVRRLEKGPERPLNPEYARAAVVNALKMVDATVVFSEDTPLNLICEIQPDVLVKGGDYDPEEINREKKTYIVGSKEVRERGGTVASIPLVPGYSTSGIVSRMRK